MFIIILNIFLISTVNCMSEMRPYYLGDTLIMVDSLKELDAERSQNIVSDETKMNKNPMDKIVSGNLDSSPTIAIKSNRFNQPNVKFNGVIEYVDRLRENDLETNDEVSEETSTDKQTTTNKPTKTEEEEEENLNIFQNFSEKLHRYFDSGKTNNKLSKIIDFLKQENSNFRNRRSVNEIKLESGEEEEDQNTKRQEIYSQSSEESMEDEEDFEQRLRLNVNKDDSDFRLNVRSVDYETQYDDYTNDAVNSDDQAVVIQTKIDLNNLITSLTDVSTFLKKRTCRCGLSFEMPEFNRIIGGSLTSINKYPWMIQIAMKKNSRVFCGGSLINDRYVLTAAHCVTGLQPSKISVRLGHTTTNKAGRVSAVRSIIIHPKYRDTNIASPDIALIRLKRPVVYSTNILPVCLGQEAVLDGKVGLVAGWGAVKAGGPVAQQLHEASVNIMETSSCRNLSNYEDHEVPPRVLCARGNETDTCQGDSGGPLLREKGANFYQVGITSWGFGCGLDKYPGVYTKVSSFVTWIRRRTANGLYCLPDGKNDIRQILKL